MWRYSALLGGGGGGTPTPTPVEATDTFSPTNFGLVNAVTATTGALDTMGAAFALGTASADLDGIILNLSQIGRPGEVTILFGGVAKCSNIPFNASGASNTRLRLPIRIPSGTVLTGTILANSGAQSFQACPIGFQRSVASTVTSITALGSTTNANNQGANIPAGDTGWKTIGTLAADAKGIAVVSVGLGADTSRSVQALPFSIDIAVGGAGSEVVLMNNISAFQPPNNIQALDHGPLWVALASGTRLSARARMSDGSAVPDAVNVQLAVMY